MLISLGVLDKTETLTPLGERVACLSCDPRLGKVLVLSAMFRCVLPMLSVAACLTRDPFHNSLLNRAQVKKVSCFNNPPVDPCSLNIKHVLIISASCMSRRKRLWAGPPTATIWCSLRLCWAGGKFSMRGTERTEKDIWKNTLCRGSAFDSSMVSLTLAHSHTIRHCSLVTL